MTGRRRRRHWKGVRVLLSGRVPPELHDEVVKFGKERQVSQSDVVATVVGWYFDQMREGRRVVSLGDGEERELMWP